MPVSLLSRMVCHASNEADFPAAIFLAGRCPNLGSDSILCCRKIGEEFSSSVETCRKFFFSKEIRTATAFSSFLNRCNAQKIREDGL